MPHYLTELTVDTWGPVFWKLLHVLSTRIGSGDTMTDSDAANGMMFLINNLHTVLPCADCQNHIKSYLFINKFKPSGLYGSALRNYIEKWLLDFHNAVRARKSQPIIIHNVEDYHALWSSQTILPCDDNRLKLYFDYGKMYKIIQISNFHRWFNMLTRVRLLLGS